MLCNLWFLYRATLGLVDFVAQLDEVFDEHLKNATVFKGTSKTVQNELLECMLAVAREEVK